MAQRSQHKKAPRPEGPSTKPGTAEGATIRSRDPGPDRLGEARRAANSILASWALEELVAKRTSKRTHG